MLEQIRFGVRDTHNARNCIEKGTLCIDFAILGGDCDTIAAPGILAHLSLCKQAPQKVTGYYWISRTASRITILLVSSCRCCTSIPYDYCCTSIPYYYCCCIVNSDRRFFWHTIPYDYCTLLRIAFSRDTSVDVSVYAGTVELLWCSNPFHGNAYRIDLKVTEIIIFEKLLSKTWRNIERDRQYIVTNRMAYIHRFVL